MENRRECRSVVHHEQAVESVRQKRTDLVDVLGVGHNGRWPPEVTRGGRMYAICFDLDQEALSATIRRQRIPTSMRISGALEKFGFERQQGSVYFGDANVTPVTCVLAVQAIQRQHAWFAKVLTDIRMLRIEEHNDLMPALDLFAGQPAPAGMK